MFTLKDLGIVVGGLLVLVLGFWLVVVAPSAPFSNESPEPPKSDFNYYTYKTRLKMCAERFNSRPKHAQLCTGRFRSGPGTVY